MPLEQASAPAPIPPEAEKPISIWKRKIFWIPFGVILVLMILGILAWYGSLNRPSMTEKEVVSGVPKFSEIPPRKTTKYLLESLPSVLPTEAKQEGYFHNADKIYYSNGPKGWMSDGNGGSVYSEEPVVHELSIKDISAFEVFQIEELYNGATYIHSLFAKDKASVYCGGKILLGADPVTFISFGSYGKDKNNVFLGCSPLAGADVASFGPHNGLVIDKSALYCGKRIEVPDSSKIEQIEHNDLMWLAKDQNAVYDLTACESLSKMIPEKNTFIQVDPTTFEVFGNFAKDKQNVFFFGDPSTMPQTFAPKPLFGADAPSFQERQRTIGGKTTIAAEDKNGIYYFTYNTASTTDSYQTWELFTTRK